MREALLDEIRIPVSVDFAALCIFTQGITWSQTKEKAPRDVFLPAWDFDTCLASANWNGSLSNEISVCCKGREKKVTHYNYSTWFTELSHLCSPTFPLISFWDLGKVCMLVFMSAWHTPHRGSISHLLSRTTYLFALKLKSHVAILWHTISLTTNLLTCKTCPILDCTENRRLPLSLSFILVKIVDYNSGVELLHLHTLLTLFGNSFCCYASKYWNNINSHLIQLSCSLKQWRMVFYSTGNFW